MPGTDIELRLLLDAIYLRYQYDFRGYAQASLKRRLRAAKIHFACETLSQLQDRVLHDPKCVDWLRLCRRCRCGGHSRCAGRGDGRWGAGETDMTLELFARRFGG